MSRERGSATVYAAIAITALVSLTFAAVLVAGLVRLSHEVDRAADLAALAGARVALDGGDGCRAAQHVAEANGTRVATCDQTGPVVTVEVRAESARHFGRTWAFEGRARAAPTELIDSAENNTSGGP